MKINNLNRKKIDFKSKISKSFLWKENLNITNLNRKKTQISNLKFTNRTLYTTNWNLFIPTNRTLSPPTQEIYIATFVVKNVLRDCNKRLNEL